MGLDMYAMVMKRAPERAVDFEYDVEETEEIHYWRKHPNLHGWMRRLYIHKGGSDPEFNLVPVQLTTEDLDQLEQDVSNGALPHTTGFFFGSSDGSEKEDDLEFIRKARAAIEEGKTVFYTSWW